MASFPIVAVRRCVGCLDTAWPDGKFLLCGGCRSVHYCSSMCQKDDWPRHRSTCDPTNPINNTDSSGGLPHIATRDFESMVRFHLNELRIVANSRLIGYQGLYFGALIECKDSKRSLIRARSGVLPPQITRGQLSILWNANDFVMVAIRSYKCLHTIIPSYRNNATRFEQIVQKANRLIWREVLEMILTQYGISIDLSLLRDAITVIAEPIYHTLQLLLRQGDTNYYIRIMEEMKEMEEPQSDPQEEKSS